MIRLPLDPDAPAAHVELRVTLAEAEAWEFMHWCRSVSWADTIIHCPRDSQAREMLTAAKKIAAALHELRQQRTRAS